MSETPPKSPHLTPAAQAAKDAREARQAAALRANLRRRKVQERGRETQAAEPPPPETKTD